MSDARTILETYLKDIVFIVGITTGVVLFIIKPMYSLQSELALQAQSINKISNNELVHVQASLDRLEASHEETEKQVIENTVILGEIRELLKNK